MDNDLAIDPNSNFFGSYADYSDEEFGLGQETVKDGMTHQEDSDQEDTGDDIYPSESDSILLEPERLPTNLAAPTDTDDNPDNSAGSSGRATRLRGGVKAGLKNKPYVVKFHLGGAGAVHANQECIDENSAYTHQIGNPNNPYSPFLSKIEWEIACWAKTRGPSSTAFTELMSIEGVSCLKI